MNSFLVIIEVVQRFSLEITLVTFQLFIAMFTLLQYESAWRKSFFINKSLMITKSLFLLFPLKLLINFLSLRT